MSHPLHLHLCNILDEMNYDPYSYSGRGMYGKSCLAINLDNDGQLWELALELGREHAHFPAPKTDSMGKGIVVYWPSIQWEEEE
jgi:hypothetical protein